MPRRSVLLVEDDRDAVAAALDSVYQRDDDASLWREMTVLDDGDEVVRGTIRLDGDELVVESSSELRQDRLIDTIADLVAITEVEDDEYDLDDGEGVGALTDLEALPDDVRRALEVTIGGYEVRWIDDAVPALGGLTPRQALDDPTRREDLFALLREMRSRTPPAGGVGMSADRIEALLGIHPT